MLNIVLHEPEIPANTGNIGRTCVATNTRLHLIEPLGFRLDEKNLKRAGMDYWGSLDVTTYIDYADFLERNPGAKIYMATTKAPKVYTEVSYEPDCYIMFGKESAGICRSLCFGSAWREGFPGIRRFVCRLRCRFFQFRNSPEVFCRCALRLRLRRLLG